MRGDNVIGGASSAASGSSINAAATLSPRAENILAHILEPGEVVEWVGRMRGVPPLLRRIALAMCGLALFGLAVTHGPNIVRGDPIIVEGEAVSVASQMPVIIFVVLILGLFCWAFRASIRATRFIATDRRVMTYRPLASASYRFGRDDDGHWGWSRDLDLDSENNPFTWRFFGPDTTVELQRNFGATSLDFHGLVSTTDFDARSIQVPDWLSSLLSLARYRWYNVANPDMAAAQIRALVRDTA